MKKRFIGPPNPGPDGTDLGHDVRVRDVAVGNVKSGEVIEIPDELCQPVYDRDDPSKVDVPAPVWSQELWEDVKASAKKSGGEG